MDKRFFLRDTRTVARELLGQYLYREINGIVFRGIISETEAYHGPEDLACHCAKGITPRTEIMFREGGRIYVYLIYGMYYMLNFTTMPDGFPAAVLIRGVIEPEISENGRDFVPLQAKTDGPGKLTKAFQIDQKLNTQLIHPSTGLWIEKGPPIDFKIVTGKRVGVDYAGEWKDKPWRFLLKKS